MKEEKTLIIIKPDALQRNLLGEIIHRFERKGLKIIGLKMMQLGDVLIEEPWIIKDDDLKFSYRLLLVAVTVSMIKQTSSILGL